MTIIMVRPRLEMSFNAAKIISDEVESMPEGNRRSSEGRVD